MDQVEALKWIKNNIENFGGNPNKVTIFGIITGGTCGPPSDVASIQGSLHQAIAESGVDLGPFAIQPISFGPPKALAQKLDCPSGDHKAMVDCIRKAKWRQTY